LHLGSLGRLHPAKGYDVLVAALARMRAEGFRSAAPFHVTIAGEGAARAQLEAALRDAGIENVHLPGYDARPREFLASLHLYLQPSRREGLCIAAHEAMQAGLPTIVSAVGELPWSVEDGETGLVTPPADPDALARALMTLLARPERLAPMGAAARARVLERFGAEAFAAAGARVFSRLPGR
jgi:glycosyltransferase involved in cell wall biosynthesis